LSRLNAPCRSDLSLQECIVGVLFVGEAATGREFDMSHSHSIRASTAAKPSKRPAALAVESAKAPAPVQPADSTRDDKVRELAYYYYEARGRVGDHEFDDWLRAEAEFERGRVAHAQQSDATPDKH
jgi:hypothetical protein